MPKTIINHISYAPFLGVFYASIDQLMNPNYRLWYVFSTLLTLDIVVFCIIAN